MRKRFKSGPLFSTPNVAPFAAVMLVLLWLMMAPSTVCVFGGHPSADMAKVNDPAYLPRALREDAIIVSIERGGGLYLGGERFAADRLCTELPALYAKTGEKKVYIKADYRAKYKNVKPVIDCLHDLQIEHIAFLTEGRRSVPRPTLP
jgi:biopolymer transport protein ExbD